MSRAERVKPCDRCQANAAVLYRVRQDASATWVFVCDRCWLQVSDRNPHYVYGGTWKAKKRH